MVGFSRSILLSFLRLYYDTHYIPFIGGDGPQNDLIFNAYFRKGSQILKNENVDKKVLIFLVEKEKQFKNTWAKRKKEIF